jgi:hypothetical protein
MQRVLLELWHFHAGPGTDIPDIAPAGGKLLGVHRTRGPLRRTIAVTRGWLGFRLWPQGYRIVETRLDHTHWLGGFRPGPERFEDEAIAGDPSPIAGNDSALGKDPDEEAASLTGIDQWTELTRPGRWRPESRVIWEVNHHKIPADSDNVSEDMGQKRIGLYSTLETAGQAVVVLRDKPGFRNWPRGFRPMPIRLDSRTAYPFFTHHPETGEEMA